MNYFYYLIKNTLEEVQNVVSNFKSNRLKLITTFGKELPNCKEDLSFISNSFDKETALETGFYFFFFNL